MAARLQGRVTNISDEDLGSSLDGDHAAGATSIVVQNAADFDEDGGTLVINDQQIVYTSCDDDNDTITLAEGLAAAADDGDTVAVWDPLREVIAVDKMASVDVGDDYADDMEAVVALHLVDHLVEGPRGDDGESVVLELDPEDDEWKVVDILGLGDRGASGMRAEADDFYVLTAADVAAGVATIPLTHRPADEWLIAVLGGVPQRPTNYTINYDSQTMTWPLDGWETADTVIWVHYAYRKGVNTQRVAVPITNTSAWNGVEDMQWPAGSSVGDLVIITSMQGPNDGFSALNGWTDHGASAAVTHASNSAPTTYRLVVLSKVRQAGDVFPTRIDGVNQSVFAVVSMTGPTGVTNIAFDHVDDAHSAATPGLTAARIRVWGTISDDTDIVPESGTVLANIGPLSNQDIDICVASDVTEAAVSATAVGTGATAGWCMATIAVEG